METLIAYTFADDGPARAAAGRARVEAYYGDLWQHEAKHHGYDGEAVGLHVWDLPDRPHRWPSWQDTGELRVASAGVPLGCQRVIGPVPPNDAPARLAQEVRRTPADFLELVPPFTMAVLDPAAERLDLFTDALGLGRLVELKLPDGCIWTNRPVAALLFAGVPAAASSRGWMFAATSGWFMDDSTPYDGVLTVPAATHIVADRHCQHRTAGRIETTQTVEETAVALRDVARSTASLWQPTIELTGGADSRVVAAAFLAAGVDVELNSCDLLPGEADVIETLLSLLPERPEHAVSHRPPADPQPPEVVSNTLLWHRYSEGLRPATTPPPTMADLTVGSAGGEVARGPYYPHDVLRLDALPLPARLNAFSNHLRTRLIPTVGPTAAARALVAEHIEQVLRNAAGEGAENATMLDRFYVAEPLRRQGTTGISPLLGHCFVGSALALTPAQRLGNTLHHELVRQLVPQWADVPFFTPSPAVSTRRTPARVRCLADVPDRDLVEQLLEDVEGFESLDTLWAASVVGATSDTAEATLRQALWRATFDQHLAEVNRHIGQ